MTKREFEQVPTSKIKLASVEDTNPSTIPPSPKKSEIYTLPHVRLASKNWKNPRKSKTGLLLPDTFDTTLALRKSEEKTEKESNKKKNLLFAKLLTACATLGLIASPILTKIQDSGGFDLTKPVLASEAIAQLQAMANNSTKGPATIELVSDSELLDNFNKNKANNTVSAFVGRTQVINPDDNFENRTYSFDGTDYTLLKLFGDWGSYSRINYLIYTQGFPDHLTEVHYAVNAANEILSADPFKTRYNKVGFFLVDNVIGLGCAVDTSKNILCNDSLVKSWSDGFNHATMFPLPETIVIYNNDGQGGFSNSYYTGSNISQDFFTTYLRVGKVQIDSNIFTTAHEIGHSEFGFYDEYPIAGSKRTNVNTYLNCVTAAGTSTIWAPIPNNPGTQFSGCGNLDEAYRGGDLDLMSYGGLGSSSYGPVGDYFVGSLLDQLYTRYTKPAYMLSGFYNYHVFAPLAFNNR